MHILKVKKILLHFFFHCRHFVLDIFLSNRNNLFIFIELYTNFVNLNLSKCVMKNRSIFSDYFTKLQFFLC